MEILIFNIIEWIQGSKGAEWMSQCALCVCCHLELSSDVPGASASLWLGLSFHLCPYSHLNISLDVDIAFFSLTKTRRASYLNWQCM
jgi:hypothetical protein